jgi:hypothetical protein
MAIRTTHAVGKIIVTNWAATRVFSYEGRYMLSEKFHTKKSPPTMTHERVLTDLRYAETMARMESDKKYYGD